MGLVELGEARISSSKPAPDFFLLSRNPTMSSAPIMMAPPTPTTTPMIVFLVLVEIPPPLFPLSLEGWLSPVEVSTVVWVSEV